LNHSLLLSTLYFFFPICCTIPNDLKNFKHVANLTWKMKSKSYHHFRHFFIQMWPSEVQLPSFSQGQKMDFCQFRHLYPTIYMVEISEIFSTSFQTSLLQDPIVTCVQQCFFLKFGTCIRNGSFGAFLVKT